MNNQLQAVCGFKWRVIPTASQKENLKKALRRLIINEEELMLMETHSSMRSFAKQGTEVEDALERIRSSTTMQSSNELAEIVGLFRMTKLQSLLFDRCICYDL
jgi:hypothetical protein